jgi:hypothetical protein
MKPWDCGVEIDKWSPGIVGMGVDKWNYIEPNTPRAQSVNPTP